MTSWCAHCALCFAPIHSDASKYINIIYPLQHYITCHQIPMKKKINNSNRLNLNEYNPVSVMYRQHCIEIKLRFTDKASAARLQMGWCWYKSIRKCSHLSVLTQNVWPMWTSLAKPSVSVTSGKSMVKKHAYSWHHAVLQVTQCTHWYCTSGSRWTFTATS